MLSLKLLAEQVGVSTATISNALNNKGKISPELRRRIVELAKKSGYTISPHALALQGKRLNILGLMIASIEDGMAQKFFVGADRAAQERDYSTILAVTAHEGSVTSEMELRSVRRFDLLRIGGVLYVPAADTEHLKVETMMKKKGLPFVLLYRHRRSDINPAVVVDHAHGFQSGFSHLIDLGHRRIGMVFDPSYRGPEVDIAKNTFRERLPDLSWDTWSGPATPTFVKRLIKQRATAVFALSDDLACSLADLFREQGVVIPRDISLVGFRNTIVARSMSPKLTTLDVPAEEMGYAAARWLVTQIDALNSSGRTDLEDSPINLCIPPSLVIRESTAPPKI